MHKNPLHKYFSVISKKNYLQIKLHTIILMKSLITNLKIFQNASMHYNYDKI